VFALILTKILFADKIFGILNPAFFPVLLAEVLEFESRMKN